MTFSIVARSPDATLFGVAIASSSPAVAARCAFAASGTGAVATQNITDPALGPAILAALARGAAAAAALAETLRATPYGEYRQLAAIGRTGPPATHTGAHGLKITAAHIGTHAAACGNLLAGPEVPAAMIAAFEAASARSGGAHPGGARLGAALLAALQAAVAAGGEAGPIHSAGLKIVREVSWPIVDLRSDWSDDPVAALAAIWALYAPQIDDYVLRALDPARAPGFR